MRALAALLGATLLVSLAAWSLAPKTPRLLTELPAEGFGHTVTLEPGEHLPGDLLLRIGEEQLRVVRIDADGLPVSGGAALAENRSRFSVKERALQGTRASAHKAGSVVQRLDRSLGGPQPASDEALRIRSLVTPFAVTLGALWIAAWAALLWAFLGSGTAPAGNARPLARIRPVALAISAIVGLSLLLGGFALHHEHAAEALTGPSSRPLPDPEQRRHAERLADPAGWPLVVQVVGQRYRWSFRYPGRDGRFGSADDVVTARPRAIRGRDLLFQMRSADVIHALALPHHGVKRDLLPGRTIEAWCRPARTGPFPIVCSELCGANHSWMRAELLVVEEAVFTNWHKELSEEAIYDHLGADPSAEGFDPQDLDPLPRDEWFGGAEGAVWGWWDRAEQRR